MPPLASSSHRKRKSPSSPSANGKPRNTLSNYFSPSPSPKKQKSPPADATIDLLGAAAAPSSRRTIIAGDKQKSVSESSELVWGLQRINAPDANLSYPPVPVLRKGNFVGRSISSKERRKRTTMPSSLKLEIDIPSSSSGISRKHVEFCTVSDSVLRIRHLGINPLLIKRSCSDRGAEELSIRKAEERSLKVGDELVLDRYERDRGQQPAFTFKVVRLKRPPVPLTYDLCNDESNSNGVGENIRVSTESYRSIDSTKTDATRTMDSPKKRSKKSLPSQALRRSSSLSSSKGLSPSKKIRSGRIESSATATAPNVETKPAAIQQIGQPKHVFVASDSSTNELKEGGDSTYVKRTSNHRVSSTSAPKPSHSATGGKIEIVVCDSSCSELDTKDKPPAVVTTSTNSDQRASKCKQRDFSMTEDVEVVVCELSSSKTKRDKRKPRIPPKRESKTKAVTIPKGENGTSTRKGPSGKLKPDPTELEKNQEAEEPKGKRAVTATKRRNAERTRPVAVVTVEAPIKPVLKETAQNLPPSPSLDTKTSLGTTEIRSPVKQKQRQSLGSEYVPKIGDLFRIRYEFHDEVVCKRRVELWWYGTAAKVTPQGTTGKFMILMKLGNKNLQEETDELLFPADNVEPLERVDTLVYRLVPDRENGGVLKRDVLVVDENPTMLSVGDLVDCMCQDGMGASSMETREEEWYRGRVAKVDKRRKTCQIVYMDGDYEGNIPIGEHKIRLWESNRDWIIGQQISTKIKKRTRRGKVTAMDVDENARSDPSGTKLRVRVEYTGNIIQNKTYNEVIKLVFDDIWQKKKAKAFSWPVTTKKATPQTTASRKPICNERSTKSSWATDKHKIEKPEKEKLFCEKEDPMTVKQMSSSLAFSQFAALTSCVRHDGSHMTHVISKVLRQGPTPDYGRKYLNLLKDGPKYEGVPYPDCHKVDDALEILEAYKGDKWKMDAFNSVFVFPHWDDLQGCLEQLKYRVYEVEGDAKSAHDASLIRVGQSLHLASALARLLATLFRHQLAGWMEEDVSEEDAEEKLDVDAFRSIPLVNCMLKNPNAGIRGSFKVIAGIYAKCWVESHIYSSKYARFPSDLKPGTSRMVYSHAVKLQYELATIVRHVAWIYGLDKDGKRCVNLKSRTLHDTASILRDALECEIEERHSVDPMIFLENVKDRVSTNGIRSRRKGAKKQTKQDVMDLYWKEMKLAFTLKLHSRGCLRSDRMVSELGDLFGLGRKTSLLLRDVPDFACVRGR